MVDGLNRAEIRYIPLSEVRKWDRNPKKHAIPEIEKSISRFGFVDPLVRDERTGMLVAGHGRLETLERMKSQGAAPPDRVEVENGEWLVPILCGIAFKSDQEAAAYVVASNRLSEKGGWDEDALVAILEDLKGSGGLDGVGYVEDDITKLLLDETPEEQKPPSRGKRSGGEKKEKPVDPLKSASSELGGVQALKVDVLFPSKAPYNIPEFLPNKLMAPPDPISAWAGPNVTEKAEHYVYAYKRNSSTGLDFKRSMVNFYCEDFMFEDVWYEPDLAVGKFLNLGILGAVTPNFSIHGDDPFAQSIWNTYRARWCGRYFQEAGISIIPDVVWNGWKEDFGDRDWEMHLAGLPKNAPCISMEFQSGKGKYKDPAHLERRRKQLLHVVTTLLPDSLWLYVGPGYEKLIDGLFPNSLKLIITKSAGWKENDYIEERSKLKKDSKQVSAFSKIRNY